MSDKSLNNPEFELRIKTCDKTILWAKTTARDLGLDTLADDLDEVRNFVHKLLALAGTQAEWISVKERLPETEEDRVLSVDKHGYMSVSTFRLRTHWDRRCTHWQPLPAAPKSSPASGRGEG